jgi:hypothetical protein
MSFIKDPTGKPIPNPFVDKKREEEKEKNLKQIMDRMREQQRKEQERRNIMFADWKPHPRREECLIKLGLPNWFDPDPRTDSGIRPAVYISPEQSAKDRKSYSACLKGESTTQPATTATTVPTEEEKRKTLYILLGLGVAVAALWWYKKNKSA